MSEDLMRRIRHLCVLAFALLALAGSSAPVAQAQFPQCGLSIAPFPQGYTVQAQSQSAVYNVTTPSNNPQYTELSWGMQWGDGGSETMIVQAGASYSFLHAFSAAGSYQPSMYVQGFNGAALTCDQSAALGTITVTSGGPPPAGPLTVDFTYAPTQPRAGDTVTFTGSCSQGGQACGSSAQYSWNVNGVVQSGQTVGVHFSGPGGVTATLSVTYNSASQSVTKTFSVSSAQPSPSPPPGQQPPAPPTAAPPASTPPGCPPAARRAAPRQTCPAPPPRTPEGDLVVPFDPKVPPGPNQVQCPPDCRPCATFMPTNGFCPTVVAPGKPPEPLKDQFVPGPGLPKLKAQLSLLAQTMDVGSKGVATVTTYIALKTLPSPDPVTKTGLAIAGFGAAIVNLGASAINQFVKYIDYVTASAPKPRAAARAAQNPGDPDFRVVVTPRARSGARLWVTRVPRRLRAAVDALNALARNNAQLEEVMVVALISLHRAAGAAAAGDEAARVRQRNAAATHLRSAAYRITAGSTLRRRLAMALRRAGRSLVAGPRELRRGQQLLRTRGLAPSVVQGLRALGAPEAWISQYREALRGVRFRRSVSVARVLVDPSLARGEQRLAAALRREANALRP